MNKQYSDKELLKALQNWQKSISNKIEEDNIKRKINNSKQIKFVLRLIKKELTKHKKNSQNDWNIIWRKIVGEEIYNNTRVKRWHNGFLEIQVKNPVLRTELDVFYKETLISSLKEIITDKKTLRGIKFISN